jgi:cell division protein FtsZ
VATYPFAFEGVQREQTAAAGLKKLRATTDSTLVIYNENLLGALPSPVLLQNAFASCDAILHEAIRGMCDVMARPSILEVNFSDVRSMMRTSGGAMFGSGEAVGDERAKLASQRALLCPLLKADPRHAKGVLLTVSGADALSLREVQEVADHVRANVGNGAAMIFGATKDHTLKKDTLRVTLVLTGV